MAMIVHELRSKGQKTVYPKKVAGFKIGLPSKGRTALTNIRSSCTASATPDSASVLCCDHTPCYAETITPEPHVFLLFWIPGPFPS
jgi:hypothetical protein